MNQAHDTLHAFNSEVQIITASFSNAIRDVAYGDDQRDDQQSRMAEAYLIASASSAVERLAASCSSALGDVAKGGTSNFSENAQQFRSRLSERLKAFSDFAKL